jgi:hypothetical protein
MVAPILQGPISELTRRYEEAGRDARLKRRKERQQEGQKWRNNWKELYEWLANESTPEVTGPLAIGMRYAPKLVAPIYLGARLGTEVGKAGAEGTFGSGPVAGLEYTPEIAEYERTALRGDRVI